MGIIFPVNINDLTTVTSLKGSVGKIVVTTTKIKGETLAYLSQLN